MLHDHESCTPDDEIVQYLRYQNNDITGKPHNLLNPLGYVDVWVPYSNFYTWKVILEIKNNFVHNMHYLQFPPFAFQITSPWFTVLHEDNTFFNLTQATLSFFYLNTDLFIWNHTLILC